LCGSITSPLKLYSPGPGTLNLFNCGRLRCFSIRSCGLSMSVLKKKEVLSGSLMKDCGLLKYLPGPVIEFSSFGFI
jgi:hypothetical protein